MKLKSLIEQQLRENSAFRERKNKNRFLVDLILQNYGLAPRFSPTALFSDYTLPKETIINLVQDFASYDRLWRLILNEQPELRGTDYDDKAKLEEAIQADLGYNV